MIEFAVHGLSFSAIEAAGIVPSAKAAAYARISGFIVNLPCELKFKGDGLRVDMCLGSDA